MEGRSSLLMEGQNLCIYMRLSGGIDVVLALKMAINIKLKGG